MKRTDLPERFQQLLTRMPYVTIATVSPDGQPWNTPVVARFDDDLNLYWVSWRANCHSRNIAHDPRIFVVVYDTSAPEGSGEGLYLQMKASALRSKAAVVRAARVYDTSFFTDPAPHEQFVDAECPQRLYKATPNAVWYSGEARERGHFIDVRTPLQPAA